MDYKQLAMVCDGLSTVPTEKPDSRRNDAYLIWRLIDDMDGINR